MATKLWDTQRAAPAEICHLTDFSTSDAARDRTHGVGKEAFPASRRNSPRWTRAERTEAGWERDLSGLKRKFASTRDESRGPQDAEGRTWSGTKRPRPGEARNAVLSEAPPGGLKELSEVDAADKVANSDIQDTRSLSKSVRSALPRCQKPP